MRKYIPFFIVFLLISVTLSAQTRVKAKAILEKINKGETVKYENVEITGDLDFTSIRDVTPDESGRRGRRGRNSTKTLWYHVRVPLTFVECVFKGDVVAYYHDDWDKETHNAIFYENIDFSGCEFQGAAAFKYVKFRKGAGFENTTYQEEALFKYTKFATPVRFTNAFFHDNANFKYTKFPEDARFDGARFRREANFKYTEFRGNASFQNAEFRRNAIFKYTGFKESVNFDGVDFVGDADFRYTKVDGEPFTTYLLNRK